MSARPADCRAAAAHCEDKLAKVRLLLTNKSASPKRIRIRRPKKQFVEAGGAQVICEYDVDPEEVTAIANITDIEHSSPGGVVLCQRIDIEGPKVKVERATYNVIAPVATLSTNPNNTNGNANTSTNDLLTKTDVREARSGIPVTSTEDNTAFVNAKTAVEINNSSIINTPTYGIVSVSKPNCEDDDAKRRPSVNTLDAVIDKNENRRDNKSNNDNVSTTSRVNDEGNNVTGDSVLSVHALETRIDKSGEKEKAVRKSNDAGVAVSIIDDVSDVKRQSSANVNTLNTIPHTKENQTSVEHISHNSVVSISKVNNGGDTVKERSSLKFCKPDTEINKTDNECNINTPSNGIILLSAANKQTDRQPSVNMNSDTVIHTCATESRVEQRPCNGFVPKPKVSDEDDVEEHSGLTVSASDTKPNKYEKKDNDNKLISMVNDVNNVLEEQSVSKVNAIDCVTNLNDNKSSIETHPKNGVSMSEIKNEGNVMKSSSVNMLDIINKSRIEVVSNEAKGQLDVGSSMLDTNGIDQSEDHSHIGNRPNTSAILSHATETKPNKDSINANLLVNTPINTVNSLENKIKSIDGANVLKTKINQAGKGDSIVKLKPNQKIDENKPNKALATGNKKGETKFRKPQTKVSAELKNNGSAVSKVNQIARDAEYKCPQEKAAINGSREQCADETQQNVGECAKTELIASCEDKVKHLKALLLDRRSELKHRAKDSRRPVTVKSKSDPINFRDNLKHCSNVKSQLGRSLKATSKKDSGKGKCVGPVAGPVAPVEDVGEVSGGDGLDVSADDGVAPPPDQPAVLVGVLLDDARKSEKKCLPAKQVRFSEEPPRVHVMHVWTFAARQARTGDWERHILDRDRFKRRIVNVDMAISWVLKPQHRSRVKFQRFMPWWHAQRRQEEADAKVKQEEEKRMREELLLDGSGEEVLQSVGEPVDDGAVDDAVPDVDDDCRTVKDINGVDDVEMVNGEGFLVSSAELQEIDDNMDSCVAKLAEVHEEEANISVAKRENDNQVGIDPKVMASSTEITSGPDEDDTSLAPPTAVSITDKAETSVDDLVSFAGPVVVSQPPSSGHPDRPPETSTDDISRSMDATVNFI